mgnify:CR=1 FL=1
MIAARRQALRSIMQLAWGLYRAEAKGPNPRTFADALAGAWRFTKRAASRAALAFPKTGHVRLAAMVRSPIRNALAGQAFASVKAAQAGYSAAAFGR